MSKHPNVSLTRGLRLTWLTLFLLCGVTNILALTGALYMLQVYDRVLASQSVPTLVALSLLAGGLYLGYAAIDAVRGQIMVRVANRVDERVMPAARAATLQLPLLGHSPALAGQPIRDGDTVRTFLGGPGPLAMLDLPWAPLYVVLIYVMCPPLAYATAVGLLFLVALTLLTHRSALRAERAMRDAMVERNALVEAKIRGAFAIAAMGMQEAIGHRFQEAHQKLVEAQTRASDAAANYAAVSRMARLALQSVIVGLGAYLAIGGEITGGAIIAASIAAGRAMAPVEQAISQWPSFVASRNALRSLREATLLVPAPKQRLSLPVPQKTLAVERISVAIPGTNRLAIADVELTIDAGTAVGITGASAAGKSSLARALVGIWPVARGCIRLDGAALDRWTPGDLGRHIGYLPQEIDLMPGTIAETIARHAPVPDAAAVIEAATAAGVHEMILRLPDGYETQLGPGGAQLSGGQRQRIALARALYGNPFLVVLDEPNSNLDADGGEALMRAIRSIKERGGIVLVVTHRRNVLAALDKIAVLEAGRLIRISNVRPKLAATDRSDVPSLTATIQVVRLSRPA
jgi:PrtD family type I secretion system ABC transporter